MVGFPRSRFSGGERHNVVRKLNMLWLYSKHFCSRRCIFGPPETWASMYHGTTATSPTTRASPGSSQGFNEISPRNCTFTAKAGNRRRKSPPAAGSLPPTSRGCTNESFLRHSVEKTFASHGSALGRPACVCTHDATQGGQPPQCSPEKRSATKSMETYLGVSAPVRVHIPRKSSGR